MKFETVRIHFLSDIFDLCHSEILLPQQCDVTTSPLYNNVISQYIISWYEKCFYQATVHENVTHMKWTVHSISVLF